MSESVALDEYQDFVESMWIPADTQDKDELRINLGLFGELGELCEKEKKYHRDGVEDVEAFRKAIEKEFGDALFYFAKKANFYDMRLSDILNTNVEKLTSRKERDLIQGSGDDR